MIIIMSIQQNEQDASVTTARRCIDAPPSPISGEHRPRPAIARNPVRPRRDGFALDLGRALVESVAATDRRTTLRVSRFSRTRCKFRQQLGASAKGKGLRVEFDEISPPLIDQSSGDWKLPIFAALPHLQSVYDDHRGNRWSIRMGPAAPAGCRTLILAPIREPSASNASG